MRTASTTVVTGLQDVSEVKWTSQTGFCNAAARVKN